MAMERAAHRKRHSAGPVIRVLFPDPVLTAARAASTRAERAQAVSQKRARQAWVRPAAMRRRWFPGLGILAGWPLIAVLFAQAALALRPPGTGRALGTRWALGLARALGTGRAPVTGRPRGTGRHRRTCPGHRGVPAWHVLAGAARR
jgi:hypothetical protein